jgi:SAM-dependent methyltransferase
MAEQPQTWHYGLVAKWWAEFNLGGPEIAYFRRFVEECGEPALDVACGTGRLLLPFLRAGLDVDGCDVSPDMIALCQEQAAREGLSPELFVQPMHALRPPRVYRTVLVCGGFGLGSTRAQDIEALRRFHACLEPGGRLVLDNEVPYSNPRLWPFWLHEGRGRLPEAWRPPGERKLASDGAEYELRSRAVEMDPLDQRITLELRALMWRDGEFAREETHHLDMRMYFKDELVLLLEQVGFRDVVVRAGYADREPDVDDEMLVFIAGRP